VNAAPGDGTPEPQSRARGGLLARDGFLDPDGRPDQLTSADFVELGRRRQALRLIFITLGDVHLELARAWIHNTAPRGRPTLRFVGRSCGLLVHACDLFQIAGLSRRAAAAWRYARLLHWARSQEAGLR